MRDFNLSGAGALAVAAVKFLTTNGNIESLQSNDAYPFYIFVRSWPPRLRHPAIMTPAERIADAVPWPVRADLLALAACIALFQAFPQLDLTVSALLHDPAEGFRWAHAPLVSLSYAAFKARHIGYVAIALALYLAATQFTRAPAGRRRGAAFMLALAIVGPVLVVNVGLKDQWGRARPASVEQFGGDRLYTPPLQPARQCNVNCSFVSGHASAAFALLLGPYWLTRRRRWLVAGILAGAAVGLGRMLQGAHFLSDVVFAFWAIYLSGEALAWLMLDRRDVVSLVGATGGEA